MPRKSSRLAQSAQHLRFRLSFRLPPGKRPFRGGLGGLGGAGLMHMQPKQQVGSEINGPSPTKVRSFSAGKKQSDS